MDLRTMETVGAAYTIYILLIPSDRPVISIDAFAEAFSANMSFLREIQEDAEGSTGAVAGGRMTIKKAEETLTKGIKEAEETIDNKEKLSSMLLKVKQKMKTLPMIGNVLSNVPIMFKLVNSYLKNEYTDISRKSLVIIVSALSYLVAPIDLIPDLVPVVGLIDDMAIVSVCIKRVKPELEKYLAWQKENTIQD